MQRRNWGVPRVKSWWTGC